MTSQLNVEDIADAISATPTRRSVAKGAAWSLPVISTAIAAPAYAASPPDCSECVGTSGPPNCIIAGVPGGTCQCASGLVCVGTGPLGLANVCVGSGLIATTCGGTQCYGICLSAGGTIPALVNTLTGALTTLVNIIGGLAGTVTGTQPCVSSTPLPSNLCVSPLNDGGLGTLCSSSSSCTTGSGVTGAVATVTIGTALTTVTTAYNTLINALQALGLVAVRTCDAPYVCQPFVEAALGQTINFGLLGTANVGLNLYVGFCQCPGGAATCASQVGNFPCTLR